jgi:glycosyltransferase involved in cell wall biosynthesis
MRILREAGHEVAIYARGHEKNEPAEFGEFFPPSLDTGHLRPSLATLHTVKELIYSDAARHGLRKVITRFRPDIVHAHNIYGRLSLSVLDELKAARVPVVMTLHDFKLLCPSYLMLNNGRVCERCKGKRFSHAVLSRCHKGSYIASSIYALESWINHASRKYASISLFIAPSRFLRDKCIAYGVDSARITFIPNFIDVLPVPQPGAGEYLLYMGRLSHEKGVATLLRACSRLREMVSLKVVGDGPEREALKKEAEDAGFSVSFTGHLSGPALEEALHGARGIVLPSEWYENAPLALLEAFAHYKPVIGARIGGIPEMIDDGVNGYLFESGHVADLQNKLQLFMKLPLHKVLEMGEAARKKVENEYSAGSHYARLMNVYRSVLEKTSA